MKRFRVLVYKPWSILCKSKHIRFLIFMEVASRRCFQFCSFIESDLIGQGFQILSQLDFWNLNYFLNRFLSEIEVCFR